MEKIKQEIFNKIDNDVYKADGDIWWQPDTVLHLLKTSVNPWRVSYMQNAIKKLGIDPNGKSALEVGSGGGILTEEICRMGFTTTGIEPAEESIRTAANHARTSGLAIQYDQGTGESLPYADGSFDCVLNGPARAGEVTCAA